MSFKGRNVMFFDVYHIEILLAFLDLQTSWKETYFKIKKYLILFSSLTQHSCVGVTDYLRQSAA